MLNALAVLGLLAVATVVVVETNAAAAQASDAFRLPARKRARARGDANHCSVDGRSNSVARASA